jgi:serine/threonine-protein kinase
MLAPGQMVGNYRIVKQLGEGGMGAVFEGVHHELGRRAAIKVLHPHLSQNAQVAARFLNEARAASIIEHPGIVEIFEFGRLDDGTTYIVMEFLRGESLTTRMERGMNRADALRVTRQIASVLAAAHEKGIIHRDLKPDNVMIAPDPEAPGGERAKVLDFGIAKVAEEYQGPDAQAVKTQDGMLLGTPTYMSPEQCRGAKDVNDRADVYSLGVMLYQMLSGALPFGGNSIAEIMHGHMYEQPKAIETIDSSLPAELVQLQRAMMAKQAAERPSMSEVVAALQLEGAMPTRQVMPPVLAARPKKGVAAPAIIAGLGVAALIAGVVAFVVRKPAPPPEPPRPPLPPDERRVDHDEHKPPRPKAAVAPPEGMVRIPAAKFTMGSTAEEIAHAFEWCKQLGGECARDIYEREQPQRQVSLASFFLDRTEVTNQAFASWLNAQSFSVQKERQVLDRARLIADLHPAHGGIAYDKQAHRFAVRAGAANKPVVQVTWDAAAAFCAAQGKALPTEAQWELAARGAHAAPFPWGEAQPRCDGVVYGRAAHGGCPGAHADADEVATASQDASPEGARDLAGNVAEWVQDAFVAPYPSCAPDCADPFVSAEHVAQPMRVIRGGDWARPAESLRSAGRSRAQGSSVQFNVGFRCAREIEKEDE